MSHANPAAGAPDKTFEQRAAFIPDIPPPAPSIGAQLLLYAVPGGVVNDGLLFPGVDLAAVLDPPGVEDIGE
jgi:hypothetical protein